MGLYHLVVQVFPEDFYYGKDSSMTVVQVFPEDVYYGKDSSMTVVQVFPEHFYHGKDSSMTSSLRDPLPTLPGCLSYNINTHYIFP